MTTISPIKPIIVTFAGTNWYVLTPNSYYYYKVYINQANDANCIFIGKYFLTYNEDNELKIELDITDILADYMYKGYGSLEPVYDAENQIFHPRWSTQESIVYSLTALGTLNKGLDINRVYVQISPTSNFTSYIYTLDPIWVTSSWNIKAPVYAPYELAALQDILSLETNFISHYPKIVTDKYGVFSMVNVGQDYASAIEIGGGQPRFYISNASIQYDPSDPTTVASNPGIKVYIGGAQGGYIPVNATLEDVILTLEPNAYVPDYDVNVFDCETSINTAENNINCGNASTVVGMNVIDCGDAATSREAVAGYDHRNAVYIWNKQSYESSQTTGDILVGILDECYSEYYLAWQTKSGVPVSYGFDGNCQRIAEADVTTIKNLKKQSLPKLINYKNKWTIRSGWVDKTTYEIFQDMLSSPWILLYSTKQDKSYYVNINTNTWTEHTVKELRRPLTFEFECEEISDINIKY